MNIIILNYPTGEVDILKNVDIDFVDTFFGGDVALYLEDKGYKISDISYMCTENELTINTHDYAY